MSCLLYPAGAVPENRLVSPQTAEDLQLGRLAEAMSCSEYYRLSAEDLNALFTSDRDTLLYRQAVLRDVLTLPELTPAMEQLLDSLDGWEGRSGSRRGMDALAMGFSLEDFAWLDGYLKKIDAAWQAFSRIPARSEGVQALTKLLDSLRNSQRYADAASDFQTLAAGFVAPAKMRLGYNLTGELKPDRFKLLRIEAYTGDKADKKKGAEQRKMMLTQRAIEMDAMLLQRVSAQASQDVNSFVLRETAVLRGLRRELIVCLSAAKLARSWQEAGLPFCFPELVEPGEKAFHARQLFDPLLLLAGRETVVPNDITLQPGGEVLLLTGANQGGKTVFLLSMGIAQWLAQLGFPVPAAEARISPADAILTVFAPNGQRYGRHGLLSEEAGRIAGAVDALTDNSMVLFNEPLTGTGPEETKRISAEVIAVCMAAGARGVWVTHVHELVRRRGLLENAVSWGSRLGSLRVVLTSEQGGTRSTYRVERGEPEGSSHADDALRRGGVSFP